MSAIPDVSSHRAKGLASLGRALSPGRISYLRTTRLTGGIFCVTLTLAFAMFLGYRIGQLALEAGRDPLFSVVLGVLSTLVILTVVGLLVFAYTRGNPLGELLDDGAAADADTHARSGELRDAAVEALDGVDVLLTRADAHLAVADEIRSRTVGEATQGVYAASVVLGVDDLVPPAATKIVHLTTPVRAETDELLSSLRADTAAQRRRAGSTLVVLPEAVPTPFEHRHQDRPGGVDDSLLDPALLLGTRVPETRTGTVRRLLLVGVAVLAAVALALGALGLAGVLDAAGAGTTEGAGATDGAEVPGGTGETASDDYSFLSVSPTGDPVRWSCDEPIRVALDPGAPAGADALLRDAVAKLSAATALPLQVVANTADSDIVIDYLPAEQVQALGGDADAIGVAAPEFAPLTGQISSAGIHLALVPENDPASGLAEQVMLHELGHAAGLGHFDSDDEIMAPSVNPGLAPQYGPGDLAGLHAVGCDG